MYQLLSELNKRGIKLRLNGDQLGISVPKGVGIGDLRAGLATHKVRLLDLLRRGGFERSLPAMKPNPLHKHDPFPLTDLQQAYWIGRSSALEMGGVATHFYVEFDCVELDVARLTDALRQMIERHDMLRAVVNFDGTQSILPSVPPYGIVVADLSNSAVEAGDQAVLDTRETLSHQVLSVDVWPLFDIRITKLPANRSRLHVSLDLLIFDAWSLVLFFDEWRVLYDQPNKVLPAFDASFRDYVLAERSHHGSEAFRRSQAYWMERLDALPPPPDLPLKPDPDARRSPRFSRREARLDGVRWERLKDSARTKGLTPSSLLLAIYAEVLARWSQRSHFTLNVTLSNRLPLHRDVQRLLGDFTSVVLQEVDLRDRRTTFLERAQRLQQQFLKDVDHADMSGIVVMHEWAKRRGLSNQAIMPVVFSSGLAQASDTSMGLGLERFGSKVYSVSQTSQVWLDHHVMELRGDLVFLWDAVDAVFEDGVLDAMFASYRDLMDRLADDTGPLWERHEIIALPQPMQCRRDEANHSVSHLPRASLHANFVDWALRRSHAPAILSLARSMTYGELLAESVAVADWLMQHGLRPGDPVGVVMRKGWEQVVAVYGVLLAGGAYMPVDADLPIKRQLELLRIGEVAHLLVQPDGARDEIAAGGWTVCVVHAGMRGEYGPAHARSLELRADQLAYVIFTSGTTGVPKGAMIDHGGPINTVEHINRLFNVGAHDRVLGVSSLSFDLSVYDIFGVHAAGGALVLPDDKRKHDPLHWRELMAMHGVTLWNSAPQHMRMLVDSFLPDDVDRAPLRTVLLSGDFIPLDIPARISQRYPDADVIGLGGATEASIWSIYHPIRAVDPAWNRIPYGKPLPNQTVWVLDEALRPCPDHVTGRIFIGGTGLAKGYWRDAEKTAASFIVHPDTGERLYDTGDIGRYAEDGNVLMLGRTDSQIKIRGHRVELGEIEAVLREHPAVHQALVMPTGAADQRQLVAYWVSGSQEARPDARGIKEFLAQRLPGYMVPQFVVALDRWPVSPNGKIDYQALPGPSGSDDPRAESIAPRDDVERAIHAVWSRVIPDIEIGVTDNFFELGGDSILAATLVRELAADLPALRLEIHELFEHLSVEALAQLHRERCAVEPTEATPSLSGLPDPAPMLADIAAGCDALSAIDFRVAGAAAAGEPRAILLTGATGWVGSHVLAELLAQTQARIYCLIRGSDEIAAHERLVATLHHHRIGLDERSHARIMVVRGDLCAHRLGLSAETWQQLAAEVDAIYHCGASLNIVADYAVHRVPNVQSLTPLLQLAADLRLKSFHFLSPMTVCRRWRNGALVVLHEECEHRDAEGLLSAYAQSKWAAEQILFAAARRGLPLKIYRTSHALPSSSSGLAKPNDSYVNVLRTACAAGLVPDWSQSRLQGVPVDRLARLLVSHTLVEDGGHGLIHIDNHDPLSLGDIIRTMLDSREPAVPLPRWLAQCREVAAQAPPEYASLLSVLFGQRLSVTAVENMFLPHPIDTTQLTRLGWGTRLSDLTPPAYWHRLARQLGESPEAVA